MTASIFVLRRRHAHSADSSTRATEVAPIQSRLDAFGAWASGLCALHCIALPLLMATLPGAGFEAFDSPVFDRGFAAFVALFGALVIGNGACLQRIRIVSALYALAVVLLTTGALAAGHWPAHATLLSVGGAMMATAHLTNRSGVHRYGSSSNLFAR